MLTKLNADSDGYIILETLVSASLIAVISAGLWQLVVTTRYMAAQSSRHSEPACVTPICSQNDELITCTCGKDLFAILP